MKLVVDTDVIAAALLGEPGSGDEAGQLLAGRWELLAPAHWKAELCSVVWKAVRLGRLPPARADALLQLAEALPMVSVEVGELWRGALELGVQADQSTYDTLFVELAVRLGTRVVSYDSRLRTRFPGQSCLPCDILDGSESP